ncbi:NAD-dependent epimerase/dehydratase family protein [Sphingobacterium thalpophilum]|uniref:NAD-dependent epimerase/dehydratase family protein n=1 Tax=Sphingobacterium thalpophilum TaxID=259 RepID=UPI003D977F12
MDRKTEKILVTGATGLVGSRLLPRLVEAGYDCTALVRGGKSAPEGSKTLEGDLFDIPSLIKAVDGKTAIIHLAAVFRSEDTNLILKSNLEGTRNLIDAAKSHSPGVRFIMASTSHVYSPDTPNPGTEEDIVAPEHAYPASKVAAENVLRESGLNWSVLRFPFVYGDGDGHLQMLPKHVKAAGWHPAMKISTIHHRDLALAVKMALEGLMDRRIVNISDDGPTSLYQLLQLVGEKMDPSADPLENPWYLHSDASLARSLGFIPSIGTVYQAARENLL